MLEQSKNFLKSSKLIMSAVLVMFFSFYFLLTVALGTNLTNDSTAESPASITNDSNTMCLITKHFEWSLDRIWTEHNHSDGSSSYKTSFGLFDHPEVYLYRSSESMQWSIGSFIGSKWYYCSERDIANCTAGKWMYFDGEWKQDIDAVIYFGDDVECPSADIGSTTETPQTTEIQPPVPVNESISIQCGETLSGTISNAPNAVILNFVNLQIQTVTFTDCVTEFDPKLFLVNSNGTYIQSHSTNQCDGNDCYDFAFCSIPKRETFTMQSLEAGSYTLKLTPYDSGGKWTVTVACGDRSIVDIDDKEC